MYISSKFCIQKPINTIGIKFKDPRRSAIEGASDRSG